MRFGVALALVLVLASCGGGGGGGPDAGHSDARALDAATDAAARGTVRVTVTTPEHAAAAGAVVVYQEPDGSVAATVTADASGVASAEVGRGGSVTAVVHESTVWYVSTVRAVAPGDQLAIGPEPPAIGSGDFTVDLPLDAAATSYDLYGPCGAGSTIDTTSVLTMHSDCVTSPMTLVAIAYDASNAPIAQLVEGGVPFVAGGLHTLAGPWAPLEAVHTTVTAIAAGTTVTVTRSAVSIRGRSVTSPPSTGTSLDFTAEMPATPSGVVEISAGQASGATQSSATIVAGAASFAFDAGAELLPIYAEPPFDPATGTVTVSRTGAHAVDAIWVEVVYTRANNDLVIWDDFGPDAASLALPTLPAEAGDVAPEAGDFVDGSQTTAVASAGKTYDDVRADLPHAFDVAARLAGNDFDVRRSASPVP